MGFGLFLDPGRGALSFHCLLASSFWLNGSWQHIHNGNF
ncbi:hypothetical protein V6Z12_D13G279900 [Gossypium hirsutum]